MQNEIVCINVLGDHFCSYQSAWRIPINRRCLAYGDSQEDFYFFTGRTCGLLTHITATHIAGVMMRDEVYAPRTSDIIEVRISSTSNIIMSIWK